MRLIALIIITVIVVGVIGGTVTLSAINYFEEMKR